jgi:hypothetical protein
MNFGKYSKNVLFDKISLKKIKSIWKANSMINYSKLIKIYKGQ